jgi:hypothetical protein
VKLVAEGATLRCNEGSAPSKLAVGEKGVSKIDGHCTARITDGRPMTNIPAFGICRVLTQAASGTPTACNPATMGVWEGPDTLISISGLTVLTDSHKCLCSIGGMITVESSNNPAETVT